MFLLSQGEGPHVPLKTPCDIPDVHLEDMHARSELQIALEGAPQSMDGVELGSVFEVVVDGDRRKCKIGQEC